MYLVLVKVELEGSKLPVLPRIVSSLPNLTKMVRGRKSVEERGTGVRRSGHEEECWKR